MTRADHGGITIGHDARGAIRLGGVLKVGTVPDALEQSRNWFQGRGELTVDLRDVHQSDSAGVALLLEWLRRAREHNCRLCFRNMPRQMQTLVDFGELRDILPLASKQTAG